jgi:hypothetical protein
MLIEAEGARLLREKRGQGRPRSSASDEEAPGPPAESECLQRKSTAKFNSTYFKRDFFSGLRLNESDFEKIDFFNKEQKQSAAIAMKELVKNGDINVKVDGRLAFIGGTSYSAVINRLGYSIVLSEKDIKTLLDSSLNENIKQMKVDAK